MSKNAVLPVDFIVPDEELNTKSEKINSLPIELPSEYQKFIHLSRYSRYHDEWKRRETWAETVHRYFDFFDSYIGEYYTSAIKQYRKVRNDLETAVLKLEVMPSMRALMTAGPALEKTELAAYNCSALGVDSPRSFDEAMYILMCGTGLGFSVESKFVNQLPVIAEEFYPTDTVIVVRDSKLGWASAFKELLAMLWAGRLPTWDMSKLRPAGSRLKTFGGRASGPEPLDNLFKFCVKVFKNAAGRKLTTLECHDIMCMIAEVIVVGGVRRCLPANAKITTPTGFVRMQDIKVGDTIVSGGKEARVREKVYSGEQQTLIFYHSCGTLETTPNHQVAVFSGADTYEFKLAKDLKVDDRLVWDLSGYDDTTKVVSQDFPYAPTTIEKIEEGTRQKTWDIALDKLHEFTANGVVVHNSALISLSDLGDREMRNAKSGQWWNENPQRAMANNSAIYTTKPSVETFMHEWLSLIESKSGERGIINRESMQAHAAENGRRDASKVELTNPCGEICLRADGGLCNLTEIVVRAEDTFESLADKARLATIMGTLQSCLTNFKYLRKAWKKNAEEERLLGVSLTGIMDNKVLGDYKNKNLPKLLSDLKQVVIDTNKEWAKILGINQSVATTTCKPSGTVSQLVDSASGIHPRFSPYYIRTVRADRKDPLAQMMVAQGFPVEDDYMQPNNYVFSFPIKSPKNAVFRDDYGAMQQLELWKVYADNWTEHNPSITVYVKQDEWLEVGAWVYKNFDSVRGISFLPFSDHVYKQAPYQEITEAQYKELAAKMPKADWGKLIEFEHEDNTTGTQTLSCTGGSCEIVDLTS